MIKIKKFIYSLFKKPLEPDGLDLRCYVANNGDVVRYVQYTFTCPVCGQHFITDMSNLCCINCGFSTPIKQNKTELFLPIWNLQHNLNTLFFECLALKRKHKNTKNIEAEIKELLSFVDGAYKCSLEQQTWRHV